MFVKLYIGKLFFVVLLLFLFFFSFSDANKKFSNYVEGEVIVKYKKNFSSKLLEFSTRGLNDNAVYLFKSKGKSTQELVDEFNNNPDVEYAEPNYIYTIFTNDTYYHNLWGFGNIDWEEAIDLVGSGFLQNLDISNPGSVIAVIDNGVNSSHIDLQNQMWSSNDCKDEYGNNIGICNDGYNFVEATEGSDSVCPTYSGSYHGTHVAGTLGAEGWNNQGVIGLNPGVMIMGLNVGVCGYDQYGNLSARNLSLSAIISAINFVKSNGVKIINASFGSTSYSISLGETINSFISSGGIFVAAAGNDGSSIVNYPCSYSNPGIICVASTDSNDNLSSFSNYSPIYVDIAAPGSSIYSTMLSNSYGYLNGTSMATPHVAGLLSLAWSYKPELTNNQLISYLFNTVDVLPSLSGKIKTEGRINAYNLLSSLYLSDVSLVSPISGAEIKGDVSLSWLSVTGMYVSGYNYFVSTGSDFTFLIDSGFTLETGVNLVLDKGTYYWGVQMVNDFGEVGKLSTGSFYYYGLSEICDSAISGIIIPGDSGKGVYVDTIFSQHFGIAFDSNIFSSGYSGYQKINEIKLYYTTGINNVLFATGSGPLDNSGNLVNMSGQNFGAYYSGGVAYLQTYEKNNNIPFGSLIPYVSGLSLVLGLVDNEGYEIQSNPFLIELDQDFLINSKSISPLDNWTNNLNVNIELRYPDEMSYLLFGSGLNTSGAVWNTGLNKTGFVGSVFGYKNLDIVLSTGDGNKDISVIFYRSGFVSEVYTSSIILDTVNLGAEIIYSTTGITNQDIVVNLVLNESGFVLNNSGIFYYTFTENGIFKFEFQDLVGNTGETIVEVNWIDKTKPTAFVEYVSGTGATSGNVSVIITGFSENITGLNFTGYIFTENGMFVFEFEDLVGNTGEAIAIVDWIDRQAPNVIGITNGSIYTTSVYLEDVVDVSGIGRVILDGILLDDWTNVKIDILGDHVLFVEDVLGNQKTINFTIKKKVSSGGGGGGGGFVIVNAGEENILTGSVYTGDLIEDINDNKSSGLLLVSGNIENSTYSDELNQAYLYAYDKYITTKETIIDANMEGTLIRSHMAKMMSNFAMNVLGKKPNSTKICQFSDIENQSDEMKSYILISCQLGLMGIGTEEFTPELEVTRAQFGTVLSRSIWGDKFNNDSGNYYEKHLLALKSAGIMNKIENPTLLELRGRVMLMLMRVEEKYK